jgi:hypothetical protein
MTIRVMSFDQKPKKTAAGAVTAPKQHYTVKLDIYAPITLSYRVQASSPEEALEMVEKQPFKSQDYPPQISWTRLKKQLAKIYKGGTLILLKQKEYK